MTHSIKDTATVIAMIALASIAAVVFGGCAGTFAPSLQTTPVAQAETTEESPERVVVATGEIRMVVQVNGRDVVLPLGWDIDIDTDELLVLGHEDGRIIEIERTEDAHERLMAIVAEMGEPATCTGNSCRADFSEVRGDLELTDDGLVFHPAPTRRVSTWTAAHDRLVTVSVPEDSRNRQTTLMLAADLSR